MEGTKRASQAFGETIREVGILVLVFLPLDAFFVESHRPPGEFVLGGVVWASMLIVTGIYLEVSE